MKVINIRNLPESILLEFITNPELNIDHFIRDMIKCPVDIPCACFFNIWIIPYNFHREPRKRIIRRYFPYHK